jgi:hypothetical protein
MPTGAGISDEVRRFVLTSIPSVPYLEALLLMRSDPAADWDAVALARRLYLGEKAAAALLADLHAAGMLECKDGASFRYAPASPQLRHMIDALAVTYATHLVEVTHLIHSKTGKKAQQFADAFKWRKDT